MAVTTKVPLGAATLNRKWCLDVNVGTPEAPDWVGVFGISEFTPKVEATTQDTTDFDSEGWASETNTLLKWSNEVKVQRKTTTSDAEAYDPGQEFLREKSVALGVDNVADIRFYEDNGPNGPKAEAYRGNAGVAYSDDGGGVDATSSATITLTGQGKRAAITHPADSGSPAVAPIVASLVPSTVGTAGGDLVIVNGSGFTGATAVDVDGVAVDADRWDVISASKIAVSVPADSAGVVDVEVTTPGGTSGTNANTKLTYA